MPSRGRYRSVVLDPVEPVTEVDIGTRFVFELPEHGKVGRAYLDPAAFGCSRLIRQLGRELQRQVQLTDPSMATVRSTIGAIRSLAAHIDGVVGFDDSSGCAALSVKVLDAWEHQLAARSARGSQSPGLMASYVLRLLRAIEYRHPSSLSVDVAGRVRHPPMSPVSTSTAPLADFTYDEARWMALSAMRDVVHTHQRVQSGWQTLGEAASGDEGSVEKSQWTWTELLRHAARLELHVEQLPSSYRAISDDALLRTRFIDRSYDRRMLVRAAYQQLFPTDLDLASFYVLLALDTGAPPEALKALTLADIRSDRHQQVTLTFTKRRAAKIYEATFADRGFPDTGTVIRSLRAVTNELRQLLDSTSLFLAVRPTMHRGGASARPPEWAGLLGRWIAHHHLEVAAHDGAAPPVSISPPWDLRRLRKTNRARLAARDPARYTATLDHTVEVFQRRYAVNATVLRVHAGQLLTDVQRDLHAEARRRHGPHILTADVAVALQANPDVARRLLGVTIQQAHHLADGHLDMGLASCLDPLDGRFGTAGEICPVSTSGLCYRCPNAVIAPHHRPALTAFSRQLEHLRRTLPPVSFEAHWAAVSAVVDTALAAFSHEGRGS